MADSAPALRARAQHYRLLAAGMTDAATVEVLQRMARECDDAAAALEAAAGAGPTPTPRAE